MGVNNNKDKATEKSDIFNSGIKYTREELKTLVERYYDYLGFKTDFDEDILSIYKPN